MHWSSCKARASSFADMAVGEHDTRLQVKCTGAALLPVGMCPTQSTTSLEEPPSSTSAEPSGVLWEVRMSPPTVMLQPPHLAPLPALPLEGACPCHTESPHSAALRGLLSLMLEVSGWVKLQSLLQA